LYNLILLLKPGLLSTEAQFRRDFGRIEALAESSRREKLRGLLREVMVRNTRAHLDVRLPRRLAATHVVQPGPDEAEALACLTRVIRERYEHAIIEIDHAIRRKLEGARPNAEVWRREIDRLEATARSYRARLVDVADRYRVRVNLRPVAVLACRLPTQRVTARLMRRNTPTEAAFSWNPLDGRIESRCCDGCNTPMATAWLCDDRVHILCESCLSPCGQCGKAFCRACHRRCPRRHEP
jgi:hypothetical protein